MASIAIDNVGGEDFLLKKKKKKKVEKKLSPSEEILGQLNSDLKSYLTIWNAANTGNIEGLSSIFSESASDGKVVLQKKVDDLDPSSQMSALHIASRNGFHEICSLLLNNGASINLPSGSGMTALLYAAQNPNSFELVSMFVNDHRANVRVLDRAGNGSIAAAIRGGSLRVCDLLVFKGADLNVANRNGVTPLMLAALNGQVSIVESLIRAGAQVDLQDKSGYSALHYAASIGNEKMVKIFLSNAECNLTLTNSDGLTAAQVAVTDQCKVLLARSNK